MATTTESVDGSADLALAKINTSIAGLDLRSIAIVLVRSGYFPDSKESQALTKILAGSELGFGPIASMQGVHLVQGRVTLAANLIAAAIQRSGRFRYRVTKIDNAGCVIKFYERWESGGTWNEVGESSFTADDAATAGLTKGTNYQHFPRNMYFARALTNGARWYTPEVFNGPIYTPDEMGATLDDDGRVIDIPVAPPKDATTAARGAAEYDRIFGTEEDRDTAADVPTAAERAAPRDITTGEVLDGGFVPTRERAVDDAAEHTRNLALDRKLAAEQARQETAF
jgi:hypothetical protein